MSDRSGIREATPSDLAGIVRIHRDAFRGFFLTQLGFRFLSEYYRLVLHYDGGILLVVGDPPAGFVAGFLDPSAFYGRLRARKLRLGLAVLPSIALRPLLIRRLLVNFRRTRGEHAGTSDTSVIAELSSVAVGTRAEGGGLGRGLVEAFCQKARRQGAERVVLTTDAHGNERVNGFYLSLGFSLSRCFEAQPGRWLNEYEMTDLGRFDEGTVS